MRDVEIKTIEGGSVALKCDFGESNPRPNVMWFEGATALVENTVKNTILFLDGGRYLYIRAVSADQRMMRYQCAVSISNGPMMRAPTTYTLTGNLNSETVFRDLGTMVGAVGEVLRFLYVVEARDNDAPAFIALNCPPSNPFIAFASFNEPILTAVLQEEARNEKQVTFTCQREGFNPGTVMGTIIVSSE